MQTAIQAILAEIFMCDSSHMNQARFDDGCAGDAVASVEVIHCINKSLTSSTR